MPLGRRKRRPYKSRAPGLCNRLPKIALRVIPVQIPMKLSRLFLATVCLGVTANIALAPRAHAQTAPPVINPQTPASLRAGITAAAQAGAKRVVIPPGIYLLPASDGPFNLEFTGLKDLEIEASGVTLLLPDPTKGGLRFTRCQNVTLRGATIRNATIPFTQGTISAIAPDRKSLEVTLDAGYPTNMDDAKFFAANGVWYLFDRATRRLKNGSPDFRGTGVEKLASDRFRVGFAAPLAGAIEVGDLTARRGLGASGLQSNECAGMTFENVSVQFAGGFGFFESGGAGGNRYRAVSVKPGPRPPGASADPLLASNADGLHSSGVGKGPLVENSLFTRMPDDGIAIHGEYQMVRRVEGQTVVAMRRWGGLPYAVGDVGHFVSQGGVPLGEAKVTAIKALPQDFMAPIESKSPHFRESRFYVELTFDHVPDGATNGFVGNLNRIGSGYVLRGNTILDHRARGILLKARDGLVENNRIDGSSIAGIVLGPELWWGEADYSRDVTIRGNTIARCGYANTGNWNRQAGALTVVAEPGDANARGHSDLRIENNTFVEDDGVNVVLDGVENVVFRGNTFVNPQTKPNTRGSDFYDTGALISIGRAKGVVLQDNMVKGLGAANTALVVAGANASEISGEKAGVSAAR